MKEHPYLPKDLYLPHYVENDKSIPEILGSFFAFMAIMTTITWFYTGRLRHLEDSVGGRLKLCWFLACGLIHTILEGYFSVFHKTLPAKQDLLAQMWKEYSKGDSRYVGADTFMVCMESITAFIDGPLAFLALYAFIRNKPYRYILQLLLSLCQLYGDVLYFTTEYKDDFSHGPYNHPLYFWFYFVFLNGIWILIPSLCLIEAFNKLFNAQKIADKSYAKKRQ